MKFFPLPEQKDYDAAVELTDEQYKKIGGAWVVAYGVEDTARRDTAVHDALFDAVTYAAAMEPYDENDEPLDPMLYHTHAFKHGMMTGNYVASLAHDGLMDTKGLFSSLNYLTDAHSASDYDRADTMVSIGENGLALLGEAARDRVDAWSDDAVSHVPSRRMYSLGCGAVLFTAYSLHSDYNRRTFNRFLSANGWEEAEVGP